MSKPKTSVSDNRSELTAVTCFSVVMIRVMKLCLHLDFEVFFGLHKINGAQHFIKKVLSLTYIYLHRLNTNRKHRLDTKKLLLY